MLSSHQRVLMNFQANGWVCVLVKTISRVAVVAIGQSTDSSTGGTLGLIHKQLPTLYLLFCLKPLNICSWGKMLKHYVGCFILGGKQSFIRWSLRHTWSPECLRTQYHMTNFEHSGRMGFQFAILITWVVCTTEGSVTVKTEIQTSQLNQCSDFFLKWSTKPVSVYILMSMSKSLWHRTSNSYLKNVFMMLS